MTEFWEIAISIAGLGGIATFFIWSLYKRWLELSIFQTMTKKQQYNLFVLFFILTFLFAVIGVGVYYLKSSPNIQIERDKKAEIQISLNYSNTIFENLYLSNYQSPHLPRQDFSKEFSIKYFRRNTNFVPHSLSIAFFDIVEESDSIVIDRLNSLSIDPVLLDIINPYFYELLIEVGDFINNDLQFDHHDNNSLSLLMDDFYSMENSLGTSLLYVYRIYYGQTSTKLQNDIIREISKRIESNFNNNWFISYTNFTIIKCFLMKQLSPKFFIKVKNNSQDVISISKIRIISNRIMPAASFLKSGPLDIIDDIYLKIEGLEYEDIIKPLNHPVKIIKGDISSIGLTIACDHMFSYKIEIELYEDEKLISKITPFVLDYFIEI